MPYDNYDRLSRNNGEQPGYFGTYEPDSDYTRYYASEPRTDPFSRRRDWENSRHRRSPSSDTRMPSDAIYSQAAYPDVSSPEAIAALKAEITERVTKELYERMKQPGSVDDSNKIPPMQRAPSNDSLSPPPTARRVYTPPSPLQQPKNVFSAPQFEEPTSTRSPLASPMDKPDGVRFSERNFRPSAARTYSTLELSTIDQKWGRLFDSRGCPTKRLRDILRGLANHIICSFEPKGTIVVTPAKLAAYYETYSLDEEPHPLLTIFRVQSNDQISLLYQDLGCEHHLVQESPSSAPIVPALTPAGFAHWMTLHITAYPDEEWYRLEKMVPHLPVDADGDLVDGKPERLPKQISRHLLPDRPDRNARKLIDDAITSYIRDTDPGSRRKASITSPPITRRSSNCQTRPVEIHQTRTSPTTSNIPPILERDRKPYSSAPVSDEETGPNNIERQRQPYSTQPGVSGKVYNDTVNQNRSDSTSTRPIGREQFERATNTNTPRGRNHSNSTAGQAYIPITQRNRRTSSPPMKSFRNTAPENINDSSRYNPTSSASSLNPGSYGSTGSFPPPPPPGPPPININISSRDDREYRRSREERPSWASNLDDEVNSPRDAERLDRQRDGYDRGSMSNDTGRGAPPDEWVRRDRNDDYGYRRY